MKNILLVLCFTVSFASFGQTKDEIAVLNIARTLNDAVFVKKDSTMLAKLFSEKLSYGHSGGKIENRQEALSSILNNQSTYADASLGPTNLMMLDKTAVTRYVFTATETTKEGKINPLKLHIMLVWVKTKGGWKLLSRQAVKLS